MKTKVGIGDLWTDPADPNSETTDCDQEKAQILADYFNSVYTKEPEGEIPKLPPKQIQYELEDLIIKEEQVVKSLKQLQIDKSPGPDGIHPQFLKNTAESISYPLCKIFNKSINQEMVPDEWKKARISAIFKKGNKKSAAN